VCGYRRDRVTRVAFWSVYWDSPIIAVRGEAVLEIEPEVARIEVSIAARGPDRAAAITALTDRDADVSLIPGDFDEIIESRNPQACGSVRRKSARTASRPGTVSFTTR
jgi:hypothetical protein